MTPLVSIIIPVYNCETFVEACVRSAMNQTYSELEIIVVNDGSKDRSADVVKGLAQEDGRIALIDQPNGGVTAARMAGVAKARGEWICFLDSDDTLPADALECYSEHFDDAPDIIVSGVDGKLDKQGYLTGLLGLKIHPELWAKLFRTSLIKEHCPSLPRTVVMGEDLMQNLVLGLNANHIVTLPALLYRINGDNPASVTKTFRHTEQYEKDYFSLMESLFLNPCRSLSCYQAVEDAVFKSRLNGLKSVVLSGNCFDSDSDYSSETLAHFFHQFSGLGPSEKLLLKLYRFQWLYRVIMTSYLRLRR